MRENAVDDEGINGNNYSGKDGTDCECKPDADSFFNGERVLQGIILEGEVLVERFDGIEGVKNNDQSTAHCQSNLSRFHSRKRSKTRLTVLLYSRRRTC